MKLNILLIVLVILAWAYTSDQDDREADREQQRYNEMRQLHSQTQGEYGWPAHDKHKEDAYLESKEVEND